MAEITLFRHVQGLTNGVERFADRLRDSGHSVSTPDVFEGRTFESIADGQEYLNAVGFATILERGRLASEAMPDGTIYAGFPLGVLSAQ